MWIIVNNLVKIDISGRRVAILQTWNETDSILVLAGPADSGELLRNLICHYVN